MNAEIFIDTNILLYSLSDNPNEKLKAEHARRYYLPRIGAGLFK